MARQLLPIAGAVIGSFAGPIGAQLGFAAGSIIGGIIDPVTMQGPKLGEAQTQTAQEGAYRPIVMGTGCVSGNIIHRGPEVIRTVRSGGKPKTKTKRRYRTFAIRICEGPVDALIRIWENEKLVYDISADSTLQEETLEYAKRFTFYRGDEDQLPDPSLEAYLGVGNVSAYRGTAHIVFPEFDLTDSRDMVPQFRFEVAQNASVTEPSIGDFTGQIYLSGSPHSTYIFMKDNGNLGYMTAPEFTDPGMSYVVGELNPNLSDVTDPQNIVWTGDYPGSVNILSPWAINQSGQVFSSFQNSADAHIINAGHYSFAYRPTDAPPSPGRSWWSAGGVYSDSYGSNIWFTQDSVYVGVEIYGDFPYRYDKRIIRFPLSGSIGIPTQEIQLITNVVPDPDKFHFKMFWDYQKNNLLVFTSSGYLDTYSPNLALLDRVQIPLGVLSSGTADISGFGVNEHILVVTTSQDFRVIDMRDMSLKYQQTFSFLGFDAPYRVIFTNDSMYIQGGDAVARFEFTPSQTAYNNPVLLSDIVDFCHDRVDFGIPKDTSELSDLVDGIVFADGYSAADAVKSLMPIYTFDSAEFDDGTGYKVHYVKRGAPVVETLTIDDIVEADDRSSRNDALERPRVLHMSFQSPIVGYAAAKASIQRISPDVKVRGEISASVPVTFSNVTEAWRRADVLMRITWVEVAGVEEITLPLSFIDLVPSDCIGLYLRGQARRLRIQSMEYSDGVIKCKAIADRQSAYTSNITGIPLPPPSPPPPSIIGPTIFEYLDIPALNDQHDSLLYYVAGTGQSPAWDGAIVERSVDLGASFEDVADIEVPTIMGTLMNTVSAATPYYTDTTNTVVLTLLNEDEIEPLTIQQFLSEGGAFALSYLDAGEKKWEVLQYKDAAQDSNGEWILSYLARGRLNTDPVAHAPGDRFVLLDGVYIAEAFSAMLNQSVVHRAVSNGLSPESAIQYTNQYVGESQREWPVAHLFAERDGSTISCRAVPRHRFGTEVNPIRSSNWSGFRFSATDGSNTLTTDSLSDTVVFNVSGWSSPITVSVSQLNRITGPGQQVTRQIA